MKKFILFALVFLLVIYCACSVPEVISQPEEHTRIVLDFDSAFFSFYRDFLNDFFYKNIEDTKDGNAAEYEFRIFESPSTPNPWFYYTVLIYNDKPAEVTCMKLDMRANPFDVDWEKVAKIEFEFNGQLSDEDRQKFLSVIEETDFWNISNKAECLWYDSVPGEEICIDGYGNNQRNCVLKTVEHVQGDKEAKIQKIHETIREIVMGMTDEDFSDTLQKYGS